MLNRGYDHGLLSIPAPVSVSTLCISVNRRPGSGPHQGAGAVDLQHRGAAGDKHGLELGLDLLQLRVDHDEVGELFGGHPPLGLPGDVSRTHGGQHRLCLQRRQVLLTLAGEQLTEQALEPVDGLDPKVAQLVTAVGEHSQKSLVTVS